MTSVVHVGRLRTDSGNGVHQVVAGLVPQLHQRGLHVEIWHFTPTVDRIRQSSSDGVLVYDLPLHRTTGGRLLRFPTTTARFLGAASSRVDLLHLHSTFVPQNIAVARVGIPYVVSPAGGHDPANTGRRLLKRVWRATLELPYLNRAACLLALSRAEREHLLALGCRAPIRVVPNGVDRSLTERSVNPPGVGHFWLYLGRLAVSHKGLDLLLRAYARLAHRSDSHPPPLVIAGPDFRGGREYLERLAFQLGVSDRVLFRGQCFGEQKWELLADAQALLLPSRWEGFPIVLTEAMALGRPVLTTDGTTLAGFVRANDAGWVVTSDVASIADGLRAICQSSPDVLDGKGIHGRHVVADQFTWGPVAEETMAVYKYALEGRSRIWD